jgi:hypothetical protein
MTVFEARAILTNFLWFKIKPSIVFGGSVSINDLMGGNLKVELFTGFVRMGSRAEAKLSLNFKFSELRVLSVMTFVEYRLSFIIVFEAFRFLSVD